jgi:hypothetical protein
MGSRSDIAAKDQGLLRSRSGRHDRRIADGFGQCRDSADRNWKVGEILCQPGRCFRAPSPDGNRRDVVRCDEGSGLSGSLPPGAEYSESA